MSLVIKSLMNVCHLSIKFFSSLGINELVHVNKALKEVNRWKVLGLELGIPYPTIERIDTDEGGKVMQCRIEMLVAWLKQNYDVDEFGYPSWSILKKALKNIDENKVASQLPEKQHTCSTEQ